MRRNAAARRENAVGGNHAAQVFRAGFDTAKQHPFALAGARHGVFGVEHHPAAGRAGAGRQTLAQKTAAFHGGIAVLAVENRREHLRQRIGGNAPDRFLPIDQLLVNHLDGDAHRRQARAFAVAGLEHVQFVVFNGELEVLHVLEVLLQGLANAFEFLVRLGHFLCELRNRLRRARARHHVFALRVDEVFAVEHLLARGGIAREGHAGRAGVAEVAEHHRLYADRCAPFVGDVVLAAIDNRAVVHPRTEHCPHRAPELFHRVLRERLAGALLDQVVESADEFLQLLGGQVGVFFRADFLLEVVHHFVERLVVVPADFLYAHDDIAVHLHEAAIAIPRPARVARLAPEHFHRLVVETEVQNRVHHAGHRLACAGADGNQQRILAVAELLARDRFEFRERSTDLVSQNFGIRLLVGVVVRADFGGNGESWRDGQTDPRHFMQVCAFAAEQRLLRAVAIGLAAAKKINILRRFTGTTRFLSHIRELPLVSLYCPRAGN